MSLLHPLREFLRKAARGNNSGLLGGAVSSDIEVLRAVVNFKGGVRIYTVRKEHPQLLFLAKARNRGRQASRCYVDSPLIFTLLVGS